VLPNSSRKINSNLPVNDKFNELNNTSMKNDIKELKDDELNAGDTDNDLRPNSSEKKTTAKYMSKSDCVVLEITNTDNDHGLL